MRKPDFSERNLSPVLLSIVFLLLFFFLQSVKTLSQTHSGKVATRAIPKEQKETRQRDDYVGSQECALCHQEIYDKYSRTDMGRPMLPSYVVEADSRRMQNARTGKLNISAGRRHSATAETMRGCKCC